MLPTLEHNADDKEWDPMAKIAFALFLQILIQSEVLTPLAWHDCHKLTWLKTSLYKHFL